MKTLPQLDLFPQQSVTVYLVHIFGHVGKCSHYIGSTNNLDRRLREHRRKRKRGGSPLLREANKRGVLWTVAETWNAPRSFEFTLKKQKNARRFCPICSGLPF